MGEGRWERNSDYDFGLNPNFQEDAQHEALDFAI
jgi:hypothetical protein